VLLAFASRPDLWPIRCKCLCCWLTIGEFHLLNSQRAVVEARTTSDSRLLRIPRTDFQPFSV